MAEIKIKELLEKSSVNNTDYIIVEDIDGTKKTPVKNLRALVLSSLYFNSVDDMKKSSAIALKEGDICETLGYYKPGDGGKAKYRITYNPAAVEDGKLVHYLSYSDTLRAELILDDKINVHQFGAVGDGKTDDTDAIQAAFNSSELRIVEFINNKTYVTRNNININKSNVVINGNGATLYPYYNDGIIISPDEDAEPINSIYINTLHINCSRSSCAFYINNAYNVNINGDLHNITNKGIHIRNSLFVNIDNSHFDSEHTGSCIVLDGINTEKALTLCSRFINIRNCLFENFSKAIHVLSTGNSNDKLNTAVNLNNCFYKSDVTNSSCVYLASPVEMITITSSIIEQAGTFLYFGGASEGNVLCRNISCLNTPYVFDIGSKNGILKLEGTINVDTSTVLFKNMLGRLQTNITWNLLPNGASFENVPIGELFDSMYPINYDANKGYSIYNSTLTLLEIRNIYVDWSSSTSNLNEIKNGVKGQLLYIRSSTNKSILNVTNKIVLSNSSIQLSAYKGILLKFDGLKWIQVC